MKERCKKYHALFSLCLDHNLSNNQKKSLVVHLKLCPGCNQAFNEFQTTITIFDQNIKAFLEKNQCRPNLWLSIEKKLTKEMAEKFSILDYTKNLRKKLRAHAKPAIAFAIIIIMAISTWWIHKTWFDKKQLIEVNEIAQVTDGKYPAQILIDENKALLVTIDRSISTRRQLIAQLNETRNLILQLQQSINNQYPMLNSDEISPF